MYHSITFFTLNAEQADAREYLDPHPYDDYYEVRNTFDDWHLVSEERPSLQPPEFKSSYVSIPGSNGSLDSSEALTGYPTYERRKGSWEFIVLNDISVPYGPEFENHYPDWTTTYNEIANFLHGRQEMTIVLEDDSLYYYCGRFTLNKWKSDKKWSKITIDYEVYPYKKEKLKVNQPWLWDICKFDHTYKIVSDDDKEFNLVAEPGREYIFVNIGEEPIMPGFAVEMSKEPFFKYLPVTFKRRRGYNMPEDEYSFQMSLNGTESHPDFYPEVMFTKYCSLKFNGSDKNDYKGIVKVIFRRGFL